MLPFFSFFLKFIYLRGRRRESQREIFHVLVHTTKWWECLELGWYEAAKWVLPTGVWQLELFSAAFPVTLKESCMETEQAGLEAVPTWDAGAAGSGFSCHVPMLSVSSSSWPSCDSNKLSLNICSYFIDLVYWVSHKDPWYNNIARVLQRVWILS